MRRSAYFNIGIIIIILISFSWGQKEVRAQPENGLTADVSLMDDYGNILVDYQKKIFKVENNHFVYSEPPALAGYVFATVNVLKLEIDDQVSFRVNYFYTQDDILPGTLPEPVPLDEMPTKKTALEVRSVWLSWIDESMKELSDTQTKDIEYFWETYKIPEPKALQGYYFDRLETGMKTLKGVKVPHFVYIYKREEPIATPPSLIFDHLIQNRSVRTVKPERRPQSP